MTKKIIILLYVILTALVVYYIDFGIRSNNMRFYSGKDTGYTLRIESIIVLNTIFFVLNNIELNRKLSSYILTAIIGSFAALGVSLLCYLFLPTDYYGLTFHIVTILLCYISYFVFKKLKVVLTSTKSQGQNNHHRDTRVS